MPFSVSLLEGIDRLTPDLKEVMFMLLKEIERSREESVTRREFLTFARKTEENFQRVWRAIERLAEAQKRTEARVEELAKAQKRTEARVEELAEAQKRTEEELKKLTGEHGKTRELLGNLTDTIGYTLENAAYKALPELLKRDYRLKIETRLKRAYLSDRKGKNLEVNILGEGFRNGNRVLIVGESKSRLSKKKVDEFIRRKLKRLEGEYEAIFPLLITHMIAEPEVEGYAKEKGIALYYSYDF